MEWKGFEIRVQLITAKAWKDRKSFNHLRLLTQKTSGWWYSAVFFLFSLMVSSISTSRIMDCYFNYRITSFSIFLSQFNCALDISLSYRECDICQQFVPRPKLFIKRVITFDSASKCFQVKKRTFVIFLIVFLFLMVSGLWFVILHVMIWIYLVWHGIFLRFQRFSDFAKSIIWVVDSARSTWRQTVGKMGISFV